MNRWFYNKQLSTIKFVLIAFLSMSFTACSIQDGEDDCQTGFHVKFEYDYNMKFADAFSNEVDLVTLYIFDEEDTYLTQMTAEDTALKDKSFYMALDLEPGTYNLIAWAGLDGVSFKVLTQLESRISILSEPKIGFTTTKEFSDADLHPLWQGEVMNITVPKTGYQETTISLVKDTKRIRVVLQQLNALPITNDDFRLEITDDNSLFDFHNNIIPNGTTTYTPYASGYGSIGDTDPTSVVYFETSTSRLMENSKARLKITRVSDEQVIINIPLIEYLLLTELEGHKDDMTSQEYLDRQDEYSLVFFLDDKDLSWLQVQIIVNGWVVRFNDGKL